MKTVVVLISLLVCNKVITAAPVGCSNCSVAPIASTGPCKYCLETPSLSREEYSKSLNNTTFNFFSDLNNSIAGRVSNW